MAVVSRGDDPPSPRLSVAARPMAKTAIVSGAQLRTRSADTLLTCIVEGV